MSPARPPTPATSSARPGRSDGEAARERLLHAGLRLFAEQGYAKTSTRELAEAAQVNIAAISYYFGDKAGLYRAVFFEPLAYPGDEPPAYVDPALDLPTALRGFYADLLEPLQQGDMARLCTKLHFREMLEPTGLWDEEIAHGIKPMHDALLSVLCRHFGLNEPDEELQRLAVALSALGVHLHVAHDVIEVVAPSLTPGPASLPAWTDRLVMYSLAMVAAERMRRVALAASGGAA